MSAIAFMSMSLALTPQLHVASPRLRLVRIGGTLAHQPSRACGVAVPASHRGRCPRMAASDNNDPALLASDVTIIFAFSFARALGNVLLSPRFEGWLAPISVDPVRFSNTLYFAGGCSVLWILGGILVGGFSYAAVADDQSALNSAARSLLAAMCLYVLFAFVSSIALNTCIDPFCADASLWTSPGGRALALTPDIVQGVIGLGLALVAWRLCYVSFRWPW